MDPLALHLILNAASHADGPTGLHCGRFAPLEAILTPPLATSNSCSTFCRGTDWTNHTTALMKCEYTHLSILECHVSPIAAVHIEARTPSPGNMQTHLHRSLYVLIGILWVLLFN